MSLSRRIVTCALAAACSTAARADLPPLVHEAVITAPVRDVWEAFTTEKGRAAWLTPLNEVDLRIGGSILCHYDANGTLGDDGTVTLEILAFEPERMLTFRGIPPKNARHEMKGFEGTWAVIQLTPLSSDLTRIRSVGLGWAETEDAKRLRDFFDAGNAYTLKMLQKHFERPDAAERDATTLRLAQRLVGGEWIHEGERPDGGVFRVRNVIEYGADGESLVARGWLGDAEGMFYHGASLFWRAPASEGGGVKFVNVNENGDVAAGRMSSIGDDTLVWDWDVSRLDETRTSFVVHAVFDDENHYRMRLFVKDESGALSQKFEVPIERVAESPARFRRLKGETTMPNAVAPVPEGFRTLTPHLTVNGGVKAIEFYKKAFGAVEIARTATPDGAFILNAMLRIGDSMLMLNDPSPNMPGFTSPDQAGSTTVAMHVYTPDVDSFVSKAEKAGANVVMPPTDMFWGDRYAVLADPSGHMWGIATRTEIVTPDEMQKRMASQFAGQGAQ